MKKITFISSVLMFGSVMCVGTVFGETLPVPEPLKPDQPQLPQEKSVSKSTAEIELEKRVQALEKKVKELENLVNNPQGEVRHIRPSLRQRDRQDHSDTLRDFEALFEQFRQQFKKQLDENSEGNLWSPTLPLDRSAPNFSRRARLGVEMAPVSEELVELYKNPAKNGVFIRKVVPGSPAETAGLAVGDCLTSFSDKPIETPEDLIAAVRVAPQGAVKLIVLRKGESLQLNVTLADQNEWMDMWEHNMRHSKDSALKIPPSDSKDTRSQDPQEWLRREQPPKHEKSE